MSDIESFRGSHLPVHPAWTKAGKNERQLHAAVDRIDLNAEIAKARTLAQMAVNVTKHQADATEHLSAMVAEMNLYDVGTAMAGNDPTKRVIALQYTELYDTSRRAYFMRQALDI